MKAKPHQSYQQLLVNIRKILQENNYEQKPQVKLPSPNLHIELALKILQAVGFSPHRK